ncbi:MAG: DUF2158 domain-containing protein [Gemmobacter sp.]
MAQHDLKPGDLVKLKSGGPVMTFGGMGGAFGNDARCFWFVSTEMKSANFPPEALERAEKGSGTAWVGIR